MCYTCSVMEKNYYEELLETLQECMERAEYQKAKELIDEEFRMPYIPMDVEKKLSEYRNEIMFQLKGETSTSFSFEEIVDMLNGTLEEQAAAIGYLENVNLRSYMDVLQDYLKEEHPRLLKSMVISQMIAQQISSEVEMKEGGMTYSFIPMTLEDVTDTDGYNIAEKLIEDTLERDNPSAARIARTLLLEVCYNKLPENFEEEEGEYLAYSCIRKTLLSLGAEDLWDDFVSEFSVREDYLWDINI